MQLQNQLNLYITELSKDQDILSLFNICESGIAQQNLQANPAKAQNFTALTNLKLSPQDILKGYNSDPEANPRRQASIPKSRQITNKRQQRKRKKHTKIYIKVLQNKIIQLQSEIQRLKKLNKVNKQYIHRLNESQHLINGYFVGRQQVIQKLEILNNQDGVDSRKILEEIVSLRLRQGVYGKDRIKAVDYYFREMVQMVLPEIQKYIIKTAIEEEDFFDGNYLRTGIPSHDAQKWRKAMLENIGAQIKEKSAKQYLFNNREQIIIQTNKFNDILIQFGKNKCKLTQQAKKLQQVLDRAHKFMRPVEISKSICYIDKYRFEKNISLEHTLKQVFEQIQSKTYAYESNKPFYVQT